MLEASFPIARLRGSCCGLACAAYQAIRNERSLRAAYSPDRAAIRKFLAAVGGRSKDAIRKVVLTCFDRDFLVGRFAS